MASDLANAHFDHNMNLSEDISTAVSDEVKALKESGRLSADKEKEYSEFLSSYLSTSSYLQTCQSDRETFDAAAQILDLTKESPEELMAIKQQYTDAYAESVAQGLLTESQASRLADLATCYEVSDIDEKTYLTEMYKVQTEHLDMTKSQQDAYVSYLVKYDSGGYKSDEDFMSDLTSDPKLSSFVTSDGYLDIPANPNYTGGPITTESAGKNAGHSEAKSDYTPSASVLAWEQERAAREMSYEDAKNYNPLSKFLADHGIGSSKMSSAVADRDADFGHSSENTVSASTTTEYETTNEANTTYTPCCDV